MINISKEERELILNSYKWIKVKNLKIIKIYTGRKI